MKIGIYSVDEISTRMVIAQDTIGRHAFETAPAFDLPDGWKRIYDTRRADADFSRNGLFAALYARTQNKKTEWLLSFRGYDGPRDLDDLLRAGFAGGLPPQLHDAYRFSRHVMEKFDIPQRKLEVIGNSFGGYLSKCVGLMLGSEKILALSSIGLKKGDLSRLRRTLVQDFNQNADHVTLEKLESVTAVYSRHDWIPKVGSPRLHGRKNALATAQNHHSLHYLEKAFLSAAGRRCAPVKLPPPEHHGIARFFLSLLPEPLEQKNLVIPTKVGIQKIL